MSSQWLSGIFWNPKTSRKLCNLSWYTVFVLEVTDSSRGVLVLLRFWQYSSELTKTYSSGTRECEVWIGNCNVNVWKSTEHKLRKIWCSTQFKQKEHTPGCEIGFNHGKVTMDFVHFSNFNDVILLIFVSIFADILTSVTFSFKQHIEKHECRRENLYAGNTKFSRPCYSFLPTLQKAKSLHSIFPIIRSFCQICRNCIAVEKRKKHTSGKTWTLEPRTVCSAHFFPHTLPLC